MALPPSPRWAKLTLGSLSLVVVMALLVLYGGVTILHNSSQVMMMQGRGHEDFTSPPSLMAGKPALEFAVTDLGEPAAGGSLRKTVMVDGKSRDEDVYWRGRRRRDETLMKLSNAILVNVTAFHQAAGISIWDWFTPDYRCPTLERVGRLGVGGKWVCGLDSLKDRPRDRPPCVIYSFGMRGNLSFEVEASNRTKCQVYVYDPKRPGLPEEYANTTLPLEFYKEELGITSGPSATSLLVRSFHDIMREKGHDFVDVVKMDLNGAEWGIFKEGLFTQGPLPFGQLIVNLHHQDVQSTFHFFQHMEKAGFRIFAREVDSEPQLKPGIPPAVEYSFINPTTFGKKDMRVEALLHSLPPYRKRMNGVVYFLTQRSRMAKIKEMLALFDKNFNARYKYPMIVFHDDLTPADQQQIRSFTTSNITFREVQFKLPAWIDPAKVPERTVCSPLSSTVGYRHMCRFLAMQVQELLQEFDWHWRIDDDSIFPAPIGYDIFRLMSENKKLYGFNRVMMDGPDCVTGLWDTTRRFLDTLQPEARAGITLFDGWLDGAAFYNNFEISHISLWRNPLVKAFMDYIDHDGGIYTIRWGDAPIRTVAVSLVLQEKQLHYFSDIAYIHKPFQNSTSRPLPDPSLGALEHLQMAEEYRKALIEDWTAYVGAKSFDPNLSKPSGAVYLIGSSQRVGFLVQALSSLHKYFNAKFDYPVWVFAHGLTYEDRLALRAAINSTSFTIEDAPFPLDVTPAQDHPCPGTTTEAMASWYRSFTIPQRLARRYEWLWQLSDDMVLTHPVDKDPFRAIRSSGAAYGAISTAPLPGGINSPCLKDLAARASAALQAHLLPSDHIQALTSSYFTGICDLSNRRIWISGQYKDLGDRLHAYSSSSPSSGWLPGVVQTLGAAMVLKPGQAFLLRGIRGVRISKEGGQAVVPHQPVPSPSTTIQLQDNVAVKVVREGSARDVFRIQHIGFLRGDVAMALPLYAAQQPQPGSPDTLWFLGSTTLGAKSTSELLGQPSSTIPNAAALTDLGAFLRDEDLDEGHHAEVHWRDSLLDGSPTGLLASISIPSGQALLPMSGIWVYPHSAAERSPTTKPDLLLLCRRYNESYGADDRAGFLGSSIVLVTDVSPTSPPRRWRVAQVRHILGTNSTHTWHSAMALEGGSYVSQDPSNDQVVILGETATRGGDEAPCQRLARLPVQALLVNLLAGGKLPSGLSWESLGPRARCIFTQQKPLEATRVGLLHLPRHKLWMMGDVDQTRERMVLRVASSSSSSLQGPWSTVSALDLSPLYREGYTCTRVLPVPWASHRRRREAEEEVVFALVCQEQSLRLSLHHLPTALELVSLRFISRREIAPQ